MNRILQVVAWGYAVACTLVWALALRPPPAPERHVIVTPTGPLPTNTAEAWFANVKPFCNGVEVEVHLRNSPAPRTAAGGGYEAACYALAGQIDKARSALEHVRDDLRLQAVGIVFDVAHPVADAGDDRAAGPIMKLVVDFWPNHYMALYHAGMSEYILNQPDLARQHLQSFLQYYESDDGWRRNAIEVLGRLGVTAR
jgi:tetratricopeptide (TPR) repeat protein